MNWIDAAIVIVFLYFIVTAFSAGFIRETIGIGSAILGIVLAGLFYDKVADTLLGSIDNATTSSVVAFLIILFGVTLAGQALAMLLKPAVTVKTVRRRSRIRPSPMRADCHRLAMPTPASRTATAAIIPARNRTRLSAR